MDVRLTETTERTVENAGFGLAAARGPTALAARMKAAVATRPTLTRWLLAGPGAIIAALLFVMAMPVWLPEGAAGVDHVVWPQVLAPLIWALFCTYTCIEEKLARGVYITAGIVLVCGVLSALAVAGWV